MTKKKILNLFSIKLNINDYKRSLFVRRFYYKSVPFILGIFFITIFFWPSIYNFKKEQEKSITENQKRQKILHFKELMSLINLFSYMQKNIKK